MSETKPDRKFILADLHRGMKIRAVKIGGSVHIEGIVFSANSGGVQFGYPSPYITISPTGWHFFEVSNE